MKTIIVSLLFFISNLCSSQSKHVTIIGNMPQEFGGEYVSFSKPLGKYATVPFYISNKDTAVIKNNKFVKKLNISTSGLIYLFEKPFNGISSARFFAEPGDTIIIEKLNKEIVYKGKNAIINKMYSDIKLAPVGFNDEIYTIFEENSGKLIEKIIEIENKYLKYYTELFEKNQISKVCLEYTTLVMKQSIESVALNIAQSQEFRDKQKMSISNEEANKIVDFIILRCIPYKEENLKSLFTTGMVKNSATFLEKQALNENKKISRFWNQFDEILGKNFGVIDYVEFDNYKELYVGCCIIQFVTNPKTTTKNYKDLLLLYNVFVEKFPNSPFIVPISEGIMNIASIELSNNLKTVAKVESKIAIGNLAIYDTVLKTIDTNPFAKPNQSLLNALSEKFPNQDVFIDFWATWCSPCIKQFTYNTDLHTFLDTKNIKTLYLSVDKEENIKKWEKYIQDYNLKGYHFLADNIYREKFIEPLGETIPRYFVFNSKTKELKLLKGLPQEKETFYANIAKALLIK